MLATLIRTWGSAPRPVGSLVAISASSELVGSVSGGCVEDDLLREVSTGLLNLSPRPPERRSYGLDAAQARRIGLPCGGTIELLLEFSPSAVALGELLRRLEAGQRVKRSVSLLDGLVDLEVYAGLINPPQEDSIDVLFGPVHRILLIGAGDLSECIARMSLMCGFEVTVCDPRDEYQRSWSLDGVKLTVEMPDDAVREFHPDCNSCVVALTHDPKLDDLALVEALESEAMYVGAIGSRKNNAARRQRLVDHLGLSFEQVSRLKGPAGIYIGSETPAEIALSIVSEIVAIKNSVEHDFDWSVSGAKVLHSKSEQEPMLLGPDF